MKMILRFASCLLAAAAMALSTAPASASLHDRGGGLIYDDVLNITLMQDAGAAGQMMSWVDAMNWAAGFTYFDPVRQVTWADWRLPTAKPIDGGQYFHWATSPGGNTDDGYNILASGFASANADPHRNELAWIYYRELGNKGWYPTGDWGNPQPPTTVIDGPFVPFSIWTSFWTDRGYVTGNLPFPGDAVCFNYAGYQGGSQGGCNAGVPRTAWAVMDGDVGFASPVAEPASYAFMLLGLGLMALTVRVRKG